MPRSGKKRKECSEPEPRQTEEDFFTLVAEGNVGNVAEFVRSHTNKDCTLDFDVNCVNFENDNAMTIAVEKGNFEMIEFLCSVMTVTPHSILMKAVHTGETEVVKRLCEELDADNEILSGQLYPVLEDPEYARNITPLMVAAIEGHFEIISYLMERGHCIHEPHKPKCDCHVCICPPSDALDVANFILKTYTAISNPSYLVYITSDPIYYSFQLYRRLVVLSKMVIPFKRNYEALAERISKFAACLVGECRSMCEVELVLKQKSSPKTVLETITQGEYPRLLMALDADQKYFVAQPKVQLFLQEKLYGCFEDWKYYSKWAKCYYVLVRVFTIPSAYFSFLFYPNSESATFYATPVNKMLHFIASYLLFLGVLLLESKREKSDVRLSNMDSIWNGIIFFYFLGFAGMLLHRILHEGYKRFLRSWWNIYDMAMVIVFAFAMSFEFASFLHAQKIRLLFRERKYWASLDPQLLVEGLLVVVTILAYLKLFYFLQVHEVMGPMQVSVCSTVKEFSKYSIFAIIVLLAYSTAFSNFYSYYSGMKYQDCKSNSTYIQEESFVDWVSSFKTFFWAAFGLTDGASADVVTENMVYEDEVNGGTVNSYNAHVFTQFIGYLAFCSFVFIMVITFRSMLIAVMVKAHQYVQGEVHKTWLMIRTEIFLRFIDGPVLPPPFNLLPQLYTLIQLREKADAERANVEKGINHQKDYLLLVRALVERYFDTSKREKECDDVFTPRTKGGNPKEMKALNKLVQNV